MSILAYWRGILDTNEKNRMVVEYAVQLTFFSIKLFYFEIFVDSHAVLRSDTWDPIDPIPSITKITSCKTIVQYHN